MSETGKRLAALSTWIDAGNAHRDSEAQLWGRVSKVTEEAGESIAALIGATGQNPRKGITHTMIDVCEELLDVAITALGAVEHINGNWGNSLELLDSKVDEVCKRAGLDTDPKETL
jgi:hypothetical protein